MFFSRKYTIIVVTFDSVGRVDLLSGKSAGVVRSWRSDRPEHAELADAVVAGLRLGPKKCGRIYVLSNEFWSGPVSVGDEVINAVAEDQLDQALAFEAERESGISPFDSRLSHTPVELIDGLKAWWVTQAESTQLDALAAAMPAWAGNIVGIASTLICPPASDNAADALLDATSSDACGDLALTWLTKYLAEECSIPVILTTSPLSTEQQRRRTSTMVAVGVLAILVAYHVFGIRQLAAANAALSELVGQEKHLGDQLDGYDQLARRVSKIKHQRETIDEVQAQRIAAEQSQQAAYAAARKRPVQLLRALMATTGVHHCVQSIDMNGAQVVVSGLAVDTTAVTNLAQRLEADLDASKWLIKPAIMSIAESTRLVRFQITLVPHQTSHPIAATRRGVTDVR